MRLLYYKPVLNPAGILPGYDAEQQDVCMSFIALMDGERTADDIIGTLLREGHSIGEIIAVFNDLHQRNIIFEAPANDPELFSEAESRIFEKQMDTFTQLGFDKGGIFLPYSRSAVSRQHRLKEARVTVMGDGQAAYALVESLVAVGVGTVYYCPLQTLGKGVEQLIAQRFKMHMHDFSEIHIHRSFSGGADGHFLRTNDASLVVYMPAVFKNEEAAAINAVCYESGKDFIPYRVAFPDVCIGPFHLCNRSACFRCSGPGPVSGADTAGGFNLPAGIDMLCVEILKYYTHVAEISTRDAIWTFDMISGKSRLEAAFRQPGCTVCGAGIYAGRV